MILKERKWFGEKVKDFFSDEYGGNLIEYALLVGFGFFFFFIIIGVIQSLLDWTIGFGDDFVDFFGG